MKLFRGKKRRDRGNVDYALQAQAFQERNQVGSVIVVEGKRSFAKEKLGIYEPPGPIGCRPPEED
jgi:hypothetical protein